MLFITYMVSIVVAVVAEAMSHFEDIVDEFLFIFIILINLKLIFLNASKILLPPLFTIDKFYNHAVCLFLKLFFSEFIDHSLPSLSSELLANFRISKEKCHFFCPALDIIVFEKITGVIVLYGFFGTATVAGNYGCLAIHCFDWHDSKMLVLWCVQNADRLF